MFSLLGSLRSVLFIPFLLASLTLFQNAASAARIIAIVGDVAITDYDVEQRTRMVAMLHKYNLKDKQKIEKIKREIVSVLVDEQIKKTFAEKAHLEIKDEMIESFVLAYGKKNGKTDMAQIKAMVKAYGVDWDFFWRTVADEIAWSQLVYVGLSNSIQFSESEISQRAIMQGMDPTDPEVFESVKNGMIEERLALDVQKMISRMKRFRVVEEVDEEDDHLNDAAKEPAINVARGSGHAGSERDDESTSGSGSASDSAAKSESESKSESKSVSESESKLESGSDEWSKMPSDAMKKKE